MCVCVCVCLVCICVCVCVSEERRGRHRPAGAGGATRGRGRGRGCPAGRRRPGRRFPRRAELNAHGGAAPRPPPAGRPRRAGALRTPPWGWGRLPPSPLASPPARCGDGSEPAGRVRCLCPRDGGRRSAANRSSSTRYNVICVCNSVGFAPAEMEQCEAKNELSGRFNRVVMLCTDSLTKMTKPGFCAVRYRFTFFSPSLAI